MIVVRVELWPGGDPLKVSQIGQLVIANQTGMTDKAHYLAVLDRMDRHEGIWHRRSDGVWALIRRVLEDFDE